MLIFPFRFIMAFFHQLTLLSFLNLRVISSKFQRHITSGERKNKLLEAFRRTSSCPRGHSLSGSLDVGCCEFEEAPSAWGWTTQWLSYPPRSLIIYFRPLFSRLFWLQETDMHLSCLTWRRIYWKFVHGRSSMTSLNKSRHCSALPSLLWIIVPLTHSCLCFPIGFHYTFIVTLPS